MQYEIMFILRPDLGEEKTNKEIEEMRKHITSGKGEVLREDIWGMRDLAYKIKKEERGFYVVLNFTIEPDGLKEIQDSLNLNQQILRYLLIHTPESYKPKTLKEYEAEAEKERKEEEKDKEEKEKKRKAPPAPVKRPVHKEKKIETPTAPVKVKKEKKEEIEPPTPPTPTESTEQPATSEPSEPPTSSEPSTPPAPPKSKLDEVDEKLKSIINDPDISL
ncbi:MAG: 30S ribosomal protein S6 [Candidatus Peregrinibacteria bacterium]